MKLVFPGICWWAVCLGAGGIAPAASAEPLLGRYESTQPQMGVPFKIILYAVDKKAANGAFEAAFPRIAELNRILSDYDPRSELSRLSRTGPSDRCVAPSDDLWFLLARSQTLAADTGGAFDVTVGPYVRLWRRARRQKQMPSDERLAQARAAVGYQYIELDPRARTARLLAPDMRLDLGGIAMGYAVDQALDVLRARGISRALIDASGDIGVGDPPPGKRGWTIGVAPLSIHRTPSREILLANAAVTTSGDAFQHVEIDDRRYSHIVDPRTGLGLTDRSGVTVIGPDCTTADSLATAVSVLGPEAGLALVEKTPGAAAFIVRATDNGEPETFASRRFKTFLVRQHAR